jgi:D-sedoheptulose 7-phosphate isomerase
MKRAANVSTQNGNHNGDGPTTQPGITSARDYFHLHGKVSSRLPFAEIDHIGEQLWRAYEGQRKVFLFGNGGNASLACHLACDLGKGTVLPEASQRRFQVLSLANNVALLTALANDLSYEQIFSEQLRTHLAPSDVAFAMSASGNSPNILRALKVSRELGGINIGLGGFEGGKMKSLCDYCAVVPSDNMQIIEDLQLSMAHALFTCLRQRILTPVTVRTQAAEAG